MTPVLLYRIAPEGFLAATDPDGELRCLHSDPFIDAPSSWRFGRPVQLEQAAMLVPVMPGKLVGVGRNYAEHARELGNAVPDRPLLFLKSPSSVIGPRASVVLPPESEQVEFEGEIAVVIRHRLRRASPAEAAAGVLGVTAACDVTARDLQRREPTFVRAKSFDTFCPLGPAILVRPDLRELTLETRLNGQLRQRSSVAQMLFPLAELLAHISASMTLEPGDVVLTGTPAGVGLLADGDRLEVEVGGVGVLENTVRAWEQGP